jgi:hypothetical protein
MAHKPRVVCLLCRTVTISANQIDIQSMAGIAATKFVVTFTVTHNKSNWKLEIEMMSNAIVVKNNR